MSSNLQERDRSQPCSEISHHPRNFYKMGILTVLFQILLTVSVLPSAFAQVSGSVVNTTSGLFRGYSPYPGVEAYLGIPYAARPVGDLRWQPPQSYAPDDAGTIRNATDPYSGCYQVLFNTALNDKVTGTREAEDCLFLSVWKPANHDPNSRTKLPVLLWVYGGGFAQGASNPNDGVDFVSQQGDIIVVSFNYRLNIFGFPTTPAIKRKNLGLLDQRAAVEWVAANIAAFGGDPGRIVMAGQSAGSTSVAVYAFAYPDHPLIAGMITMSGQPETNLRDDGSAWRQVAERVGCGNKNRTREMDCMREVAPRRLKRGISNANIIEYGALTGGSPTVDNKTLFSVEEYVSRGLQGRFAKIVSSANIPG
jgi:carboxylesterase type B